MDKKELRRYIRDQKKQHSVAELSVMSCQICESIKIDGVWRAAGVVLLYYALPDEVDTKILLDSAVFMGKTVLLPVVVGDSLELRVYEGLDSLSQGAFGILEPTGMIYPQSDYDKIDLAIIPGMAFDVYGNRLGRGKGYYDRLLPNLSNTYKVGVCFPFQKLDCIPSEPHDIKVNEVVSLLSEEVKPVK